MRKHDILPQSLKVIISQFSILTKPQSYYRLLVLAAIFAVYKLSFERQVVKNSHFPIYLLLSGGGY